MMGRRKEKPLEQDVRTDQMLDRLTDVVERLERLAEQQTAPKVEKAKP